VYHQPEPQTQAQKMTGATNVIYNCLIYILLFIFFQGSRGRDVEEDCKTCRKLVTKFQEGVEKTAKNHFGGGDTAWEESRLGKYARSETRLLEILEKVCDKDSSKDACHAMVEEYEDEIESFWFKKQNELTELETHLCNNVAKCCCPTGKFGKTCEECPGAPTKPCFGRGTCNGDGTRGGTGKCDCDSEYTGELCDECAEGYYDAYGNATCKSCHETCESTCTDGTNKGCDKCKDGYIDQPDEGCVDVDECEDANICEEGKFCINKAGTHVCNECDPACKGCNGTGRFSCKECNAGWVKTEAGGCEDINECEGEHGCEVGTYCLNKEGSHSCEACSAACSGGCIDSTPKTCVECANGYQMSSGWLTSDGCVDIDECKEKNKTCPLGTACVNKPGVDSCEPCSENCIGCLSPEPTGCVICKLGFYLAGSGCEDLNECATKPCKKEGEKCSNTHGSYKCLCKKGWVRTKDGDCKKKVAKKKKEEVEDSDSDVDKDEL